MKLSVSVAVLTAALFCNCAKAQSQRRSVHYNFIGKDSIKLSFNRNFELIEDSCSEATRYGHFNMQLHKFIGKVKDMSQLEPNVIMTEGTYSDKGTKEGPFITRYVNGKLQAKGSFVNNNFDGKWELYYENGSPRLFFEAKNDGKDINITDFWDATGRKQVENGKGKYSADANGLSWEGHLLNGKPEGSWDVYKTNDPDKVALETEKYKDGVFQKGKSPIGEYTDASRIVLVSPAMLPFVKAEELRISARGCNVPGGRHVEYVRYKEGMTNYTRALENIVSAVFVNVDLKHYSNGFNIEGEVNDQGFLTSLSATNSFNQQISNALIIGLKQAPKLEPATINGNSVNEKVTFIFSFSENLYHFSYRFGAVIDKSAVAAKK